MIGYILYYLIHCQIFSFATTLFLNERDNQDVAINCEIALLDCWVGII